MAATPQYGSMIFKGLTTQKTYSVDVYVSDVNGASINFDAGGGAGATSETFITFSEPVSLVDYAQVTGTADTEKIRLTAGGKPTAHVLRYVIHVSTIATRPALNIRFQAGSRISALQISD